MCMREVCRKYSTCQTVEPAYLNERERAKRHTANYGETHTQLTAQHNTLNHDDLTLLSNVRQQQVREPHAHHIVRPYRTFLSHTLTPHTHSNQQPLSLHTSTAHYETTLTLPYIDTYIATVTPHSHHSLTATLSSRPPTHCHSQPCRPRPPRATRRRSVSPQPAPAPPLHRSRTRQR